MGKPSIDLGLWTQDPSKVIEPSVGKKAEGFNPKEKPPAQYFNWYWKGLLEWAKWLFTVSIDTATSITSFDINKGTNVVNSGTNTTTVNCSELTVDSNSSNGVVSNSANSEIENTTNFDIKNADDVSILSDSVDGLKIENSYQYIEIGEASEDSKNITIVNSTQCKASGENTTIEDCSIVTVRGLDNKAEFSKTCNIYGSNNSIKNCFGVTINSDVSRSSVEGVYSFTEYKDDTKTVENFRIHGNKMLKSVLNQQSIYPLGNASQNMFGNRDLSEEAYSYWQCEGVNWREGIGGSAEDIVGGDQTTDGLYSNGVAMTGSTDLVEFPIESSLSLDPANNYVNSFWAKLDSIYLPSNTGTKIFSFGSDSGGFGWEIEFNGIDFVFKTNLWSKIIPNIKRNEYHHYVIMWSSANYSFSLYIDGEIVCEIQCNASLTLVGGYKISVGPTDSSAIAFNIKTSDVSFWNNTLKTAQQVKQLYCGAYSKYSIDGILSMVHKSGDDYIESPKVMSYDNTENLLFLEFPKWMKSSSHVTTTKLDISSESYELE